MHAYTADQDQRNELVNYLENPLAKIVTYCRRKHLNMFYWIEICIKEQPTTYYKNVSAQKRVLELWENSMKDYVDLLDHDLK